MTRYTAVTSRALHHMNGSGGRLAIFDVCGTLFSANTTFGFLDFFHQGVESRAYWRMRWWVTSRHSPAFYPFALMQRAFRLDLPRAILVRSLAGTSVGQATAAARRYSEILMATAAISPIMERLEKHKAAGDRIVLMSSSIEPVVAAIADALGVEYRASTLEAIGGTLTGRLARDLTSRKHLVLDELPGEQDSSLFVYTDNLSDRPLVMMADHATIILSGPSKRRRWRKVDADFLEL